MFTIQGIIEGYLIVDIAQNEYWIVNQQLVRIDREGNIYPISIKI